MAGRRYVGDSPRNSLNDMNPLNETYLGIVRIGILVLRVMWEAAFSMGRVTSADLDPGAGCPQRGRSALASRSLGVGVEPGRGTSSSMERPISAH